MEFLEVNKEPEFILKLSLQESIALWQILSSALYSGNEKVKPFVDALYSFAENSNSY